MAMNLVKSAWEAGTLFFRNRSSRASVLSISPQGARETMTVTDIDTDDGTLTAAALAGGLIVHTCGGAGGTLTFDTAANIIAAFPGVATGETVECYLINDGTTTATLAADGGATVTLGDDGQTIAADESCILLILVTAATTVTVYTIGA